MKTAEFVVLSLEENKGYIERAIKDLNEDELAWRVKPHSNSVIFLLGPLARVEDLWINRNLLGGKDIYETAGWFKKFGTAPQDSGFGYDVKKLDAWPVPSLALVQEY